MGLLRLLMIIRVYKARASGSPHTVPDDVNMPGSVEDPKYQDKAQQFPRTLIRRNHPESPRNTKGV